LGKQRSRCCGFAASTAGVQAAASFSASVIVLPSQSQQLSGAGVPSGKQSIDARSGSEHTI
jgi:beta-phosphoglucomutase-like phosphatase (HAD superfamily)